MTVFFFGFVWGHISETFWNISRRLGSAWCEGQPQTWRTQTWDIWGLKFIRLYGIIWGINSNMGYMSCMQRQIWTTFHGLSWIVHGPSSWWSLNLKWITGFGLRIGYPKSHFSHQKRSKLPFSGNLLQNTRFQSPNFIWSGYSYHLIPFTFQVFLLKSPQFWYISHCPSSQAAQFVDRVPAPICFCRLNPKPGRYPLVNKQCAIENGRLYWIFPLKMVIFPSVM